MSNTVVAELVTVTITGEPINAEIVEMLDYWNDDYVQTVDVRLIDGSVHERADVADISLFVDRLSGAVAA